MKFIKFKEAQGEILVPNVGPVPFYIEGATGVFCVEFTDDEIRQIKGQGNRLYLFAPVLPGQDRPLYFRPHLNNPFIKPRENGNAQASKS